MFEYKCHAQQISGRVHQWVGLGRVQLGAGPSMGRVGSGPTLNFDPRSHIVQYLKRWFSRYNLWW